MDELLVGCSVSGIPIVLTNGVWVLELPLSLGAEELIKAFTESVDFDDFAQK